MEKTIYCIRQRNTNHWKGFKSMLKHEEFGINSSKLGKAFNKTNVLDEFEVMKKTVFKPMSSSDIWKQKKSRTKDNRDFHNQIRKVTNTTKTYILARKFNSEEE